MSRERLRRSTFGGLLALWLGLLTAMLVDLYRSVPAGTGDRPHSLLFTALNGVMMALAGLRLVYFAPDEAEWWRERVCRHPSLGAPPAMWQGLIGRRPWLRHLVWTEPSPAPFKLRGAVMVGAGLVVAVVGLTAWLLAPGA